MSLTTAYLEKVLWAIVGAQLIDNIRSTPVQSSVVLIGLDGRIVSAGPSEEVAVPEGVPTTHASGMTLLPGLIDAHVHLVSLLSRTPGWFLGPPRRYCDRADCSA